MALAKKSLEILTETMFYVLMAFLKTDMCGTDVAAFIDQKTKGRIQMGPGTLYTILAKFRITDRGRRIYAEEVERLRRCLLDAEEEAHTAL